MQQGTEPNPSWDAATVASWRCRSRRASSRLSRLSCLSCFSSPSSTELTGRDATIAKDPKQTTVSLTKLIPKGAVFVAEVLKKLLALRLQLNLIHKNVAINACLRSRSWQLAVHHLGSISLQSMQPNEVTYNTIISTCLEWKLAFYLLRHLQNALISPSTTTYNAMTSAVSWQLSCKLLSEMKFRMIRHDVQTGSPGSAGSGSPGSWDCELGRVYQMRRCNLKPDVVNYGMLLGRCDAQTWRTGNSILCHMSEWLVRPNEIIFGSFVNMIGTTMDWRASVVNLDRMALLCLARDELSPASMLVQGLVSLQADGCTRLAF